MLVLGIESTCDETAVAVVRDGRRVLSNVVASQADLHAVYRGVVPEIACRAHIENLLPTLREALDRADADERSIDAIAVAHRPGLIGSLLIGVTAAKTLAWAWGKPLLGVDHVQAHLHSVVLHRSDSPSPQVPLFPAVGLVVSGGHTALYTLRSFEQIVMVGSTIDDAVGEAYDKVSAILGLGYPGGPIIDMLARAGNAEAVRFPRTLLDRDSLDFSFSGLKTAVLYHVRGKKGRERDASSLNDAERADVAASFQQACIDVILEKLRRAIDRTQARSIIVGGGVSANRGLRAALPTLGLPVHLPAPEFCTDNAAMIASLGDMLLQAGHRSDLDLDAITYSQLVRAEDAP
jgi:N6-L-threonylcarbamoyladenine synthase